MEDFSELRFNGFLVLVITLCFSSSPLFVLSDRANRVFTVTDDQKDSNFSTNFLFGTASSAYQFEGAFRSDGKGLNNWDVFTHKSDKIIDGSNGDISVDHYDRYLEDIELMDSLGVNSYRFSISWARILPRGRFGSINPGGIQFYNNLIDALLRKGIEPFVTLCHYDIPQELEDRYRSWLSPQIQEDFRYYADICFKAFGDRVKYWSTFNEPNVVALQSYQNGLYPPGRCSGVFGRCAFGDSKTEPFIAAHNMILSHASAVQLYRNKYQEEQKGSIGIVMNCIWFEPLSDSLADKLATKRAQSFFSNWFLDPIMYGRYPAEMRDILGSGLPLFSKNDKKKLQSGSDFIGINHYTSLYIKDCMFSSCPGAKGASRTEGFAYLTGEKDGVPIGEPTSMYLYYVHPQGMEKTVTYLKERYNNTPMYIAENGYGELNNGNAQIEDSLNDTKRVNFMSSYLDSLANAIRKGADVRGYFVWSLLDNFEWVYGYTRRFGIFYVDFTTLKRTPKLSATWYRKFIAKNKATTRSTLIARNNQQSPQNYAIVVGPIAHGCAAQLAIPRVSLACIYMLLYPCNLADDQ
ncbi:hypothetical protein MKX03_019517 [Papaver bracteatum]|nr:hypothetical protein MKX03_019517 [Papaver bracteatum]